MTKQQRLTAFFDIHAAASASSGEQRAQASATMGTDASSAAGPGEARDMEPRRRQGEMLQLSKELQKYRRENAGAPDLEVEIEQSCRLRNWPPGRRMLDAREITSLYAAALGRRQHENYRKAETLMLYACACDKLEWCIAEKLLKAEPICADGYPLMRQLQDLLRDEAPLTLSRNAILASMAQPPVLNSLPQSILKSLPKKKTPRPQFRYLIRATDAGVYGDTGDTA